MCVFVQQRHSLFVFNQVFPNDINKKRQVDKICNTSHNFEQQFNTWTKAGPYKAIFI